MNKKLLLLSFLAISTIVPGEQGQESAQSAAQQTPSSIFSSKPFMYTTGTLFGVGTAWWGFNNADKLAQKFVSAVAGASIFGLFGLAQKLFKDQEEYHNKLNIDTWNTNGDKIASNNYLKLVKDNKELQENLQPALEQKTQELSTAQQQQQLNIATSHTAEIEQLQKNLQAAQQEKISIQNQLDQLAQENKQRQAAASSTASNALLFKDGLSEALKRADKPQDANFVQEFNETQEIERWYTPVDEFGNPVDKTGNQNPTFYKANGLKRIRCFLLGLQNVLSNGKVIAGVQNPIQAGLQGLVNDIDTETESFIKIQTLNTKLQSETFTQRIQELGAVANRLNQEKTELEGKLQTTQYRFRNYDRLHKKFEDVDPDFNSDNEEELDQFEIIKKS